MLKLRTYPHTRGRRTPHRAEAHKPPEQTPARKVAHDTRVTCRACGAEVTHVQLDEKWHTRDMDGMPHALVCST
jgi:hypothetical protein